MESELSEINLKEDGLYHVGDFSIRETRTKKNTLYSSHSSVGKASASSLATILVTLFECKKIIFFGVAGAINDSYEVGDIIIADQLCQYDVDLTSFGYTLGATQHFNELYIETSKELNQKFHQICRSENIAFHRGVIATGDTFIADVSRRCEIYNLFHADAVEMEGGAIAFVCKRFNIECAVVRSISDKASENAEKFFADNLSLAVNNISLLVNKYIELL